MPPVGYHRLVKNINGVFPQATVSNVIFWALSLTRHPHLRVFSGTQLVCVFSPPFCSPSLHNVYTEPFTSDKPLACTWTIRNYFRYYTASVLLWSRPYSTRRIINTVNNDHALQIRSMEMSWQMTVGERSFRAHQYLSRPNFARSIRISDAWKWLLLPITLMCVYACVGAKT